MSDNNQPPIIKKIKKGHHGHHGGAWKVAYADFVTAMMALFIVLWILGSNDEVKEAVAQYFNDPSIMVLGLGKSIIDQGRVSDKNPQVITTDTAVVVDLKKIEEERFKQMGEEIKQQLGGDPRIQELLDQIEIEYTAEGMRIELVESMNDAFFEVGTASLNPRALQIVKLIGEKISTLQNRISIEGHTDSRPFIRGTQNYTNFELSADRANSARRALLIAGVSPHQISDIRGFSDNKLKNVNDPFDVKNRRVSIIIKHNE